jgi:hypothetical protein
MSRYQTPDVCRLRSLARSSWGKLFHAATRQRTIAAVIQNSAGELSRDVRTLANIASISLCENSARSDQDGAVRFGFSDPAVTRGRALFRAACQLMNVAAVVIVSRFVFVAVSGVALIRLLTRRTHPKSGGGSVVAVRVINWAGKRRPAWNGNCRFWRLYVRHWRLLQDEGASFLC